MRRAKREAQLEGRGGGVMIVGRREEGVEKGKGKGGDQEVKKRVGNGGGLIVERGEGPTVKKGEGGVQRGVTEAEIIEANHLGRFTRVSRPLHSFYQQHLSLMSLLFHLCNPYISQI